MGQVSENGKIINDQVEKNFPLLTINRKELNLNIEFKNRR